LHYNLLVIIGIYKGERTMALINCPECNKEVSDKAKSCPNCGYPFELIISSTPSKEPCEYCGFANPTGSDYCDSCGMRLTEYYTTDKYSNQKPIVRMQHNTILEEQTSVQNEMYEHDKYAYENQAKCPMCNSTSLSGNKKGFGIGKAVLGAWAIGPIGLIAGNVGSKNLLVTCLNCGYKFKR
jgi:RNA polymerase subunit RPABC4/transcription elongation factor Spt4